MAKNALNHVSTCDTWFQATGASLGKKQRRFWHFGILTMLYLNSQKVWGLVYRWPRYFGLNLAVIRAKIHFMVLTLLKFQNVNWFIRNTDFPVNSFWKISSVYRPKTPPTTPRSLFWHINCGVTKWKITHYKYAFRWLSSSYNIHTVELKERVNIALVWDYPLLVSQFSSSSLLQFIISS